MNKLKYLVFGGKLNLESIIFPSSMSHDDMAHQLGVKKENILGAGFVKFVNEEGKLKCECYGDSFSLRIPSRPVEDSLKVTLDYLGLRHSI